MFEVVQGYRDLPPCGPGTRESQDELIHWLKAIHVAHVDAGDAYDYEGYRFFFLWYCCIAE